MFCPNCSTVMKNVLHFEQDRQYQYNECPHCYKRTKNKRIHFDDVVKEEVLNLNKISIQTVNNNMKGNNRVKKNNF